MEKGRFIQLGWFVAYWFMGVAAVGIVAMAIRFVLR